MNSEEFFQQIGHLEASWGSKMIRLPVFYYDRIFAAERISRE